MPSVLWSLYAALKHTGSYWDAVCLAIEVGGDVDTTALDEARINTLPLWDVDKINGGVRSITKSAQEARALLGGGQ